MEISVQLFFAVILNSLQNLCENFIGANINENVNVVKQNAMLQSQFWLLLNAIENKNILEVIWFLLQNCCKVCMTCCYGESIEATGAKIFLFNQ